MKFNFLEKEEFLSIANKLYSTYGSTAHSFYLGRLLSIVFDEDVDISDFEDKNAELEKLTAKQLNVKEWFDGASIVLIYASRETESKLDPLPDEVYNSKYTEVQNHYLKQGWNVMFELIYDLFVKSEIKELAMVE